MKNINVDYVIAFTFLVLLIIPAAVITLSVLNRTFKKNKKEIKEKIEIKDCDIPFSC